MGIDGLRVFHLWHRLRQIHPWSTCSTIASAETWRYEFLCQWGVLPNLGQATTEVRLSTTTGRQRNVTWQNVNIEFPILGTKMLASDPEHKSEIRYREDGGTVVELRDDHSSPFVSHGDVYFMKVYMKKKILQKHEGFVRPGAAP